MIETITHIFFVAVFIFWAFSTSSDNKIARTIVICTILLILSFNFALSQLIPDKIEIEQIDITQGTSS